MKKSKTTKIITASAAVLMAVSCGNTKTNAQQEAEHTTDGVTVMKIDTLTLTTIKDDEGDKRMPNSLFYGKTDSAKVERLSPDGSVSSSISCYLVETQGKKVLFDTGNGTERGGMLLKRLDDIGVKYDILEGEGAFYGPKIEYHLKDCLGRSWQCGTIQVDFQMPGRLGAEYVAEDNTRKVPVMLHRAMLGSLERWIGMLIEEYAGAFPVWLAPVQVAVASITDAQSDYVKEVAQKLHEANIRVETDLRNEKINYKIRELSLQKIPYIAVVGDKEKQAGAVAVRARGGKDLGVMSLDDFIAMVRAENDSRAPFAH